MKINFKNKAEIICLVKRCPLYYEAERIKKEIAAKRKIRIPFYLDLEELNEILKFKLQNQYNRQKSLRQINENQTIKDITKLALNIKTENPEYMDEIRIKLLSTMKGINVPTASAILALVFPKKYAIIDRRTWRYLNPDNKKTSFTINDYLSYLKVIRNCSKELSIDPQLIDMALWQKDFE